MSKGPDLPDATERLVSPKKKDNIGDPCMVCSCEFTKLISVDGNQAWCCPVCDLWFDKEKVKDLKFKDVPDNTTAEEVKRRRKERDNEQQESSL